MTKTILTWLLRIVAAIILLQTLYFKFTAQPESVELFNILGMEPWGRISTGIAELITAVLILIPRTLYWVLCLEQALWQRQFFSILQNWVLNLGEIIFCFPML